MLTYSQCVELMQTARNVRGLGKRRKLENNTYLVGIETSLGSAFQIILYETAVVTIYQSDRYQLKTGGWLTPTTKDRINKYSPARIYPTKGVWHLGCGSPFRDGMVINQAGSKVGF